MTTNVRRITCGSVGGAARGPYTGAMGRRRRAMSRKRRILFGMVALACSVLLMEVVFRTGAWLTGRTRGHTYDATFGWRMLPNVEKWGNAWSDKRPGVTNSHGWRDGEHAYVREVGGRRVLVLGDSMTFGASVDYGERFTEVLEDDGTEVINMGVCAWGTDQEVLAYEAEGRLYRPDIVLLVVTVNNDLNDMSCERQSGWAKPFFTLNDGELQLHEPAIDWTVRLRCVSYLAELAMQVIERSVPSARVAPAWKDRDTLLLFRALVRRLAVGVEAQGARLLAIIEQPGPEEPAGVTENGKRLLEALQAEGIATLDVGPRLDAYAGKHEDLNLPCGHWSPTAHRIVADEIRTEFVRRNW